MLKVIHRNNLNELKSNLECLEDRVNDFEIPKCAYMNSVACFGKELTDYGFTSLDWNLNFILPILKSEIDNRINELTREIWGVSHYVEITKTF
ncbi:hypothetical protein M9Y10_045086 [Tritrichomonas musculus]|uniref:Uncharacterized protein n=1 Tax=Tritrichomonas musculus TaxID=1915356 RepID=A0ABR2JUM6_9EUKA